jgi:prolyl oligopeptidase
VLSTQEGTYIETDLNAPNKRIVTVDVNNQRQIGLILFRDRERFVAVHRWVCQLYEDAVSVVKQYDYMVKCYARLNCPD